MSFQWTASRMDQLERAVRQGLRVALVQRGTEHIVVARRLEIAGPGDVLVGVIPMTGDERRFHLDRIDDFQVIQ